MKKFYYSIIAAFLLFSQNVKAQKMAYGSNCSVTINLDNSTNQNNAVEAAYVILDRHDLTAAGYVHQKFDAKNNKIIIANLAEGKYFAEVYIKGVYNQHFSKVISVAKKKNVYSFKLKKAELYKPDQVIIPAESNDFSKTSVVFMK